MTNILQVLQKEGFIVSLSQGRRLVLQHAVSVDGVPVVEVDAEVSEDTHTIKVGKKIKTVELTHGDDNNTGE
jgi:ribosomal protein S4